MRAERPYRSAQPLRVGRWQGKVKDRREEMDALDRRLSVLEVLHLVLGIRVHLCLVAPRVNRSIVRTIDLLTFFPEHSAHSVQASAVLPFAQGRAE